MHPPLDLANQRFGKLVALRVEGRHPAKGLLWLCSCDCGGSRVALAGKLSEGKARSCGCIQAAPRQPRARVQNRNRERAAWNDMIRRCTVARSPDFANYGGRGITVCESWRKSFDAFLAEVGPRPSARHSIDRIDNDRGYEPGNCRWATAREQQRNRRNNRLVTIEGETLCVAAWADRFGAPLNDVFNRLRDGWDPIRALTTPVVRRRQIV